MFALSDSQLRAVWAAAAADILREALLLPLCEDEVIKVRECGCWLRPHRAMQRPRRAYPNVYREPGKELCDNLVVFENHIIILSDKSCQFPQTGDLARDWTRWFKRAVHQSARQVYGAERWLREQPGRLFIDAKCTQPFPLPLPQAEKAHFHRVVVAFECV
jgi:hypothetical protein